MGLKRVHKGKDTTFDFSRPRLTIRTDARELEVHLRLAEWRWYGVLVTVGRVLNWSYHSRPDRASGHWLWGIRVLLYAQRSIAHPHWSHLWTLGWPLRMEEA